MSDQVARIELHKATEPVVDRKPRRSERWRNKSKSREYSSQATGRRRILLQLKSARKIPPKTAFF